AYLVNGDDRWVAKLSGAAGLAKKTIEVLGAPKIPGARDFDGHGAAQLRIVRLVHRPEGALANGFDQLELAELLAVAALPTGRGFGFQVETEAAGGAGNLFARNEIDDLDRVMAVWAKDVHSNPPIPRC